MTRLRETINRMSRLAAWVSGLLVLVLMTVISVEVFMRSALSSTLGGTIEISEVLLVFIVFTGLAYTQHLHAHVSTDIVTSRLSPSFRRILRTVAMAIASCVILWALVATARRGYGAWLSGEARFGIRSVPIWPARLAIPIGLLLLAAEAAYSTIDAWRGDGVRSAATRPIEDVHDN